MKRKRKVDAKAQQAGRPGKAASDQEAAEPGYFTRFDRELRAALQRLYR